MLDALEEVKGTAVTAPTAAPRKRRREHAPGGQSTAMVREPPCATAYRGNPGMSVRSLYSVLPAVT